MELVKSLGTDRPVFVIDDGNMLNGQDFTFKSINDAATASIELVRGIAAKVGVPNGAGANVIALAGWSYGGVVATEVAKLLTQEISNAKEDTKSKEAVGNVVVKLLILFDSPLRSPTASGPEESREGSEGDDVAATSSTAVTPPHPPDGEADLAKRIQKHFTNCTKLLSKFHQRPPEGKPLECAVYDVRPLDTSYASNIDAIDELTKGAVVQHTVAGSHWTMLFGDKVEAVSRIVTQALV